MTSKLRAITAAIAGAVVAVTLGAGTASADAPDPAPAASQTIGNADGSTTLVYQDGATFTSGGGVFLTSGTFTWTAEYDNVVDSRQWTTGGAGDLWIDITSISDCGGIAHKLDLFRANGSKVGTTRFINCAGGSYVWRSLPQGTYFFQLYDPYSGDAYFDHSASGAVRYV